MLARIAEALFWLGRDLARAEHTARMLDGVFHADVQGRPDDGAGLSWDALLAIIGARAPEPRAVAVGQSDVIPGVRPATRWEVTRLLTIDPSSPAAVVTCVSRGRERAAGLRDVISTEMWEALNTFHLGLAERDLSAALQTGPYSLYQYVKERCALFWGLVDRTMMRDEARSFLDAGGRIESADMVLRMLRVALPPAFADGENGRRGEAGDSEALALIHAVGGYQAYRRAVRAAAPDAAQIARFLLFDAGYPGSVAASLGALHDALVTADPQPRSSAPVLRLGRLLADLEFRRRAAPPDDELTATLGEVQDELAAADYDIAERYFAAATAGAEHRT